METKNYTRVLAILEAVRAGLEVAERYRAAGDFTPEERQMAIATTEAIVEQAKTISTVHNPA